MSGSPAPESWRKALGSRHSFFRTALTLTAFALLQKFLALGQQIILARTVGLNITTDAYYLAQTIPMIVGAIISVALTTTLISLMDRTEKQVIFGTALSLIGLLTFASVLIYIQSNFIIGLLAPNLDDATAEIANRLLRELSPLTALMGVAGILTAYYYHELRFSIPAVSGCLIYIGSIVGVLLVPHYGIDALSGGLLCGGIFQLFLLAGCLNVQWRHRPVFSYRQAGRTLWGAAAVMGITSITPLYVIVDRALAAGSPPGTLAALGIAANLMTIPSALIVANLNSAILPGLVRARDLKTEFAEVLRQSILYIAFFLVPATIVMISWANPIIRLLFASPHFDSTAIALTGTLLARYSLAILGIALKDIVSNALVAMNREWIAVVVGVTTLVLSALIKTFQFVRADPARIALSTSIAVWAGAIFFIVICSTLLPIKWSTIALSGGWKVAVASAVLAGFSIHFGPRSSTTLLTCVTTIAACAAYLFITYMLGFDVRQLGVSGSRDLRVSR